MSEQHDETFNDPEEIVVSLPSNTQQEFQETCTQFLEILKIFDYITPSQLEKIKEYINDPSSTEKTAAILYPYNKNLIDCCKNTKSSYMFMNDIMLFDNHLSLKVFVKESKKTKKNIVKHLSNILTKSLPLVSDPTILEKNILDVSPELSKLVQNITQSLGDTDINTLDPMSLLFPTPGTTGILDTIKDKLKDVDQTKVFQEVMGLMQQPQFLETMASTFSNQNNPIFDIFNQKKP